MASIRKRRTATGELRYDLRYRVQGRLVEQTFKRRRDAENRVRQVEADELTGGLVDPALGRETLASYSATWLEARLVRGRPLAAMTRQGYQGLLRCNILPALGSVPIANITTDAVRSWYSGVIARSSPDQAAKSYRLLRAILTGHQGKPITRSRLSAAWRQACRTAHAPAGLRIHDLRHHAATLAARMPGITTKELMARIGHSSPRAALIYQHAADERDRTIADFLDQAIAATPSRSANHPLDLHRGQ